MLDIIDSRSFEVNNFSVKLPGHEEKKSAKLRVEKLRDLQRKKSLKDYSIYA